MTAIATLSKDTSDLISGLNTYITDNNLGYDPSNPPATPLVGLGDVSNIITDVPVLETFFDDLGLTVKSVGVYTIFWIETPGNWSESFLVIPMKDFDGMSLVTHDIKDGAEVNTLPNGTNYYSIDDTTDDESIPFTDNTVYFINTRVTHSFRYSVAPNPELGASGCANFLVIGTNEDISSYFA